MKLIFRFISWLVVIGVVAYFFWFTVNTFQHQDFSGLSSFSSVLAIVVAACLYVFIIPVSAWAWTMLLKRQGEVWRTQLLASVMGVTQVAKYIPGNVAQHFGRAALAMKYGMKLKTFTISVVQESLLVLGASAFVGVSLLQFSPDGFNRLPEAYQTLLLIACMMFAVVLIVCSMGLPKLPALLSNYGKLIRLFEFWGEPIGPRTTLLVFSAYCANYFLIGLGMWCVAWSLGIRIEGGYVLFTSSFALAWVLGFLAPGAPAGLGVREGALAFLLAGSVDDQRVLTLILAMRIVTVMGDGLCWLVGLIGLHRASGRMNEN